MNIVALCPSGNAPTTTEAHNREALLLMGKDHREFCEAFTEKRRPVWSGR